MSTYLVNELHPLVLRSIDHQRLVRSVSGDGEHRECGCDANSSGDRRWLCEWHDGYRAGIGALLDARMHGTTFSAGPAFPAGDE